MQNNHKNSSKSIVERNGVVTINDVAKHAETSIATVSRVLNNPAYKVSDDLRERVLNAVSELNYSPNLAARSLRSKRNNMVGVVIPSISNPFYQQTILGIESVLDPLGYHIILHNTEYDIQKERRILRNLNDMFVSNVILSSVDPSSKLLQSLSSQGMNFIFLDQNSDVNGSSYITFDAKRGAKIAVNYLIEQGHRDIAFATSPLTRWTRIEIFKGYKEALASAGIPFQESLNYIGDDRNIKDMQNLELELGRQLANRFYEEKCQATAVLCINDMLAIGFMSSITRFGMSIPEDVSIIGFDDIQLAEYATPPLTTIRYASYDTGRLAGMMHTESISEDKPFDLQMHVTPQLVIRDSVIDLYVE
ncbi:MAG: LacI family transcriptional regulator [Fastidiosipila sp.]|nr:LacI family transcriptional regulator [Fastidiosipila sp.]